MGLTVFLSFLGNPVTLIAIGTILGGAIIGFLNLVGVIGKVKSDDVATAKKAADFVIENLERKIKVMEENMKDISSRMDTIQVENKTLRDVLQGKDPMDQQLRQQSIDIMTKTIPAILEITGRTEKSLDRLVYLIDRHINAMENMHQAPTITTTIAPTQGGI